MNEVAKTESSVPDYVRNAGKDRERNLDSSDMILPRVKLMQLVSPELETFNSLSAGDIFHTILEDSIGKEVSVVPMDCHKTYVIWGPRGSDDQILARSTDGVNWDREFQNTEIMFTHDKKVKKRKIKLGVRVSDHGLTDFGSSDPNKEGSAPIATLTYEWLLHVVGIGPVLFNLSRSGVKPAKQFFTKISMRGTPWTTQQFTLSSRREGEGSESYMVPTFTANGWAPEDVMNSCNAFLDANQGVRFKGHGDDVESNEKVRDDI